MRTNKVGHRRWTVTRDDLLLLIVSVRISQVLAQ
jgi:hypothetical protein